MEVDFGGVMEDVVTRKEFPLEKAREILKGETVAVLGYGVQGPGQALNLRDNGINVIVGQRETYAKEGEKPKNWEKAISDGWIPGETLFTSLEEAARRGTIVQYLLSDAGQSDRWRDIKPCLNHGDALYFSHGFSIVYSDQTKVVPPSGIDVIMVAPKGPGKKVREHFLEGKGINSSFAIHQDDTGRAYERTIALGMAIGSGYLFQTTFQNEVRSDLVGERGALLGAISGIMKAQYKLLRSKGHSPSEAFNETVEEATQSLYPLIGENGLEEMIGNCSTTAQRGALDWAVKFEKAVTPLFEKLYERVVSGEETAIVLAANSDPDYRKNLDKELEDLRNSEMGQVGIAVRSLRPENQ